MIRRCVAALFSVLAIVVSVFVTTLPAQADPATATVVSSPNVGANNNVLASVSCASSTFCMAVGSYANDFAIDRTLTMTSNGTTWSTISSPNVKPYDNELTSVSCTSSTFCMAVGFYNNEGANETLTMTWNGTTWSTVTSPNGGSADNRLTSVSCTSSTLCIAVGYYGNLGVNQTLAMTWNGTTWSTVTSPNTGAEHNTLASVSCVSESFCIAVGDYLDAWSPRTLAMNWNGTTWSTIASPTGGSTEASAASVSCTGSSFCIAVGDYVPEGIPQTLVVKWDGTTWNLVSSPSPGTDYNALDSVSCTSPTSCIAVGEQVAFMPSLLMMEWNGTDWTVVTSPEPGGFPSLVSVSCVSSTTCVSVGRFSSPTWVNQTLVVAITTPFTAPSAPTTLIATVGNTTVSIAFTPGAAGSSAITKYQYTTNDGTSWTDVSAGGTSSPVTISGLTNYVVYSIKLRAYSTEGGAASTAVSVETKNAAPTFTTAYSARVNGYAFRGILAAYTRVTPPTGTMVSYQITAYARGTNTVVSSCTAKATWERCFIYGLTTGTQYDVRVKGLLKLPATPSITRTTLESNYVTIRV